MRLTTPAVLGALALCSPAAAQAAEPWGDARTVDGDAHGRVGSPAVGIGERGYVVAAWTRSRGGETGLVGARRTPTRGFRDTFTIEPRRDRMDGSAIELDGKRNAIVAYRRSFGGALRIGALTVRANGARTRRYLFAGEGDAGTPRFADPPFARPLLAWTVGTQERDLEVAEANEDGTFDARVRFDLRRVGSDVAVAGEPRGRTVLSYVRTSPDATPRVVVARRIQGTVEFSVQNVSDGRWAPREPAIAVARNGRALVTWFEGTRFMGAERAAGSESFGAPRELAAGALRGGRVIATSRGALLAAFRATDGSLQLIRPGGRSRLSRPGTRIEQFRLRAGGTGGATAAWIEDTADEPGGVVRAVAITSSGRIGKVQRLSGNGERAPELALATGERGDAMALWTTRGGERLRGARRPD